MEDNDSIMLYAVTGVGSLGGRTMLFAHSRHPDLIGKRKDLSLVLGGKGACDARVGEIVVCRSMPRPLASTATRSRVYVTRDYAPSLRSPWAQRATAGPVATGPLGGTRKEIDFIRL